MATIYLFMLISVALTLSMSRVSARRINEDCPEDCECYEDETTDWFEVICTGITNFDDFSLPATDLQQMNITIVRGRIGDIGRGTFDGIVSRYLILNLKDTSVGVFQEGSLIIQGAGILSLYVTGGTIEGFADGAFTAASADVMFFRGVTIKRISQNAFSTCRMDTFELVGATVTNMEEDAFRRSSMNSLIINGAWFGVNSRPFTGMDRIGKIQISTTVLPTFPHDMIPETFAESSDDASSTYMYHNFFTQIEEEAFGAVNNEFRLQRRQFYNNSIICDSGVDWMTPRPDYLPEVFYKSLVCAEPEELCGSMLHTCDGSVSSGESVNCDKYKGYRCKGDEEDGVNAAPEVRSLTLGGALVCGLVLLALQI